MDVLGKWAHSFESLPVRFSLEHLEIKPGALIFIATVALAQSS